MLLVNLAAMMQLAGAAWLMVSLSSSALLVGMVQTAAMLPSVLVSLPGGVLADLIDRRSLLLAVQSWLLATTLGLAVLTFAGVIGPWSLLALTAAVGLGFALQGPAWFTSLTEGIPRPQVPAAVSLLSLAFQSARAIGPAFAGAIVAIASVSAVFLVCAAFFIAAMGALVVWSTAPPTSALPPEGLFTGLRGALRYVRHSPVMRVQLLRTGLFVAAASGLWALLPLVARDQLGMGAGGYGILLGTLGGGSIVGAVAMPLVRRRLSFSGAADAGGVLYALALLVASQASHASVVLPSLLFAGVAWIVVGNTQTIAIQTSVPAWVRSRAISVYILAFQGSMALGGIVWGGIATLFGTRWTLLVSALAIGAALLVMRRYPARLGEEAEVTPSMPDAIPVLEHDPRAEEGPVAVQVDYRIRPESREEFVRAMYAVGVARRRDGASAWRLYRNLADPTRYAERFVVDSWMDYLRHRARATVADRLAEERAAALHIGPGQPELQHFITEFPPREVERTAERHTMR